MPLARPEQPVADLVARLIEYPEAEWLEFKENNFQPDVIGEYISALSNSAAIIGRRVAYLIWGVRDSDRSIVGTAFAPETKKVGNEPLENWLSRLLSPRPSIQFAIGNVDEHPVVALTIPAALREPVQFKGVAYIRVGSQKKKLSEYPEKARLLWQALGSSSFESGIARHGLDAVEVLELLDYPAYFHLFKKPHPETRSGILESLHSSSLIAPDDMGRWAITNLGAVLFARNLDQFSSLSRKAVRVIRYSGNARIKTIKEQEVSRGYAAGFADLVKYIVDQLPENEIIGQALREVVPMYPELAIRELVANALIHQDFVISGAGPTVALFNNRIEISNPGRPLIDPSRFIDYEPRTRNEALGRAMRRVGICEERGSGWDKIGFEVELHGLPAPLVEATEDFTRVVLFAPKAFNEMDRSERIQAVYLHACLRYVARERMTNTSLRERFKIDRTNAAVASRLIREAIRDKVIALADPQVQGFAQRSYVPFWAAPGDPASA